MYKSDLINLLKSFIDETKVTELFSVSKFKIHNELKLYLNYLVDDSLFDESKLLDGKSINLQIDIYFLRICELKNQVNFIMEDYCNSEIFVDCEYFLLLMIKLKKFLDNLIIN